MRPPLIVTTAMVAALAGLAPPAGHAAAPCSTDWPTLQHDAGRTASTSCTSLAVTTVPTLTPSWFVPTTGAVTAEPAVVAGTAYVGDGTGVMRAIDATTGASRWTFDVTSNSMHVDRHSPSYGEITSSASVVGVPRLGRTVFFGGGGTVYAIDAATGRPRWATDIDPGNPTSTAEVESSPVVWVRSARSSVVFVGMDTNEDKGSADGGVVALDAATGDLLWKYDAETGTVVRDLRFHEHAGTGCGDIWASPALDPVRRLLFFGAGNCRLSGGGDTERLTAIHADSGRRAWAFDEPNANHGSDQDFGASPVLTRVHRTDVVVQPGKSGWVYVLARTSGRLLRSVHVAEGSSIGGFIGSTAVSNAAHGDPVLFGDTAVPVHADGHVDATDAGDPARLTSLHAVDLATGTVLWRSPAQAPSYAPVTVAGDVVFAPDTTEFSVNAYDAGAGLPLWHLPSGAAMSGGVAVSGGRVVFGGGTFFGGSLPPQVTGVWCFALPG